MSLENRGIFQLLKKETQPAITSEDWNTDGSLVRCKLTKMRAISECFSHVSCLMACRTCRNIVEIEMKYGIMRLEACRSVLVKCIWEMSVHSTLRTTEHNVF